jgi:nicotinamide mononucleotide transporter
VTAITATRPRATKDILVSIGIAFVLTAVSYILGLHLNWIEVIAVFTSYMATWLCVVERRFNYPMGIISSAFYAWLFIDANLVASTIVNIYLVFYLFYGYARWGKDKTTRPVQWVKPKWWPVYIVFTIAAYALVFFVAQAFGGAFLWTDSLILILTILAQVLLDNKKLDNWIVWLVMDVFATWEYYHTGLYLVGFQYIFFTINTVIGFGYWMRSYRRDRVVYAHNPKFDVTYLKDSLAQASEAEAAADRFVKVRFIGDPPEIKFAHEFPKREV